MSKKIVSKIRTAAETTLQGVGCVFLLTACIGLFVGVLCYFTGDHIDRAEMNRAFASVWSGTDKPAPRSIASQQPASKTVVSPAVVVVTPAPAHAASPATVDGIAPALAQVEEHSEEIAANSPREAVHPRN